MLMHFRADTPHKKGEPNESHQHGHHHHLHHHHGSEGIKSAFFLNLGFAIIELIGGFFTNSVAILSDAIHDIGDAAAIGLAWIFEDLSKKNSNKKYTYGYGRLSIISALITSVILLSGSIFIIAEAIPRLLDPEGVVISVSGMIWLAILGVFVNSIAVFRLKKSASGSLNQKAVTLHLMEDALGWIAVLIGSIIMYFTGWTILDPIMSLGISAYILFNVFKMLRSIFKVFLQAIPENMDMAEIENKITSVEGVASVHDLHVWTLDNEYHILSLHLVVDVDININDIKKLKSDTRSLLSEYGIKHATIEIETQSEDCLHEDCV